MLPPSGKAHVPQPSPDEPWTGGSPSPCITNTPNTLMATLHDRMLVILSPKGYDRWLDPSVTDPDDVQPLLRPYRGEMQA